MLTGKFLHCLKVVEDGLTKRLSGCGPDFVLEFENRKSEFAALQIDIYAEFTNRRRLYVHLMVLGYAQNGIPSTVLHFVDIRHGLHECKKERNIVRHRQIVLDRADSAAMPWGDCRADYMEFFDWGCIVWGGKFEVSHHSKELQTCACAEFIPVLTYLVGG